MGIEYLSILKTWQMSRWMKSEKLILSLTYALKPETHINNLNYHTPNTRKWRKYQKTPGNTTINIREKKNKFPTLKIETQIGF